MVILKISANTRNPNMNYSINVYEIKFEGKLISVRWGNLVCSTNLLCYMERRSVSTLDEIYTIYSQPEKKKKPIYLRYERYAKSHSWIRSLCIL